MVTSQPNPNWVCVRCGKPQCDCPKEKFDSTQWQGECSFKPAGVDIAARPCEQQETKTPEPDTAQSGFLTKLLKERNEERKERLAKVLEAYHKDKPYTKEELESSKGYPFQI